MAITIEPSSSVRENSEHAPEVAPLGKNNEIHQSAFRRALVAGVASLSFAGVGIGVGYGLSQNNQEDPVPTLEKQTWIGRTMRSYEDVTPTGTYLGKSETPTWKWTKHEPHREHETVTPKPGYLQQR